MKFQSRIFVRGKNIFLLANVSFIFSDIYKIRGSMCLNWVRMSDKYLTLLPLPDLGGHNYYGKNRRVHTTLPKNSFRKTIHQISSMDGTLLRMS